MRRTRMANRVLLTGTAAVVLTSALTACGHTVTVGAAGRLEVALSEYRVVPQSVQARAGQLTLVVENDGRLTHNLAISVGARVLVQTPPIPPRGSAYLTMVLGPGSYLMTSTLFSDQALGTYGTLTVVR